MQGAPIRVVAPQRGLACIGPVLGLIGRAIANRLYHLWKVSLDVHCHASFERRGRLAPRPGLDMTDNRLTTRGHMDVLDRHLLLAFAAMLVEGGHLLDVKGHEPSRVPKRLVTDLGALPNQGSPAQTFQSRKMGSDHLLGQHTLKHIARRHLLDELERAHHAGLQLGRIGILGPCDKLGDLVKLGKLYREIADRQRVPRRQRLMCRTSWHIGYLVRGGCKLDHAATMRPEGDDNQVVSNSVHGVDLQLDGRSPGGTFSAGRQCALDFAPPPSPGVGTDPGRHGSLAARDCIATE